jgi:hypothetical protein
VVKSNADNLTLILMQALMHQRGLTENWLVVGLWHLELMGFLFFKALN